MKSRAKILFFTLLLCFFSLYPSQHNNEHKANTFQKAVVGAFLATYACDVTLMVSKYFQAFIFGSSSISQKTQHLIEGIAHSLEMRPPLVQQANVWWHSVAGSIFSNYDVLFINDDKVSLDDAAIAKKINECLINIKYHRDRNILIAGAVIPIFVFGGAKAASVMLKRISTAENSFWGTMKKDVVIFSESFKAKALVSLLSLYGLIVLQDYYLKKAYLQ